ncbi:MAG: chromosomal replication initiator protein DnaA [Myxococcota bacterium]
MTELMTKTATELWGGFLTAAAGKLSAHVIDSWLAPIRCSRYENATVVLEVRDQFARDWLRDHYVDFIRDELSLVAGESVAVDWIVNPELRLADTSADDETHAPPESPTERSGVTETVDLEKRESRQLNSRYVFDSFVSGPSNQFAFAACKAVAENPASSYNPLFLFGGVGLGKTHLLSAIGHQILREKPRARIIYTSSEAFVNEVINAVRFSKLDEFHNKYRRNCDVFLVDDIQLIAGKDRTQHEFFHIFNTLYDSQRQIVVTSDKLPHEIPDIEERLRNRFQWGLIADVQPPEIETRVAILRKKADSERVVLADEVIFFLAKNIRSNVRELEGALVRLMAHASLTGQPLNVDYAQAVLADILQSRSLSLSVESIQKLVASYYQVKIADLKSSRRQRILVRPRQVAMYLCRKHAGASFPELGTRFGDKDHTTIMSACKKVDSLLKTDAALRKEVLELERRLDVLNP